MEPTAPGCKQDIQTHSSEEDGGRSHFSLDRAIHFGHNHARLAVSWLDGVAQRADEGAHGPGLKVMAAFSLL